MIFVTWLSSKIRNQASQHGRWLSTKEQASMAEAAKATTSKTKARQILPPPPPPKQGFPKQKPWPQTPPVPPPPPTRKIPANKNNHCRWFNFGLPNHLCKFDDCKFRHVDKNNWDHHTKQTLPEDDPMFVTEHTCQLMQHLHEPRPSSSKRMALQNPVVDVEQPPEKKQKTDKPEKLHLVTKTLLDTWLDRARGEVGMPGSIFRKDIINLITSHGVRKRYPFEECLLRDAQNNVVTKIEIHQEIDIVWCSMLYGKRSGVMGFLANCLQLGYMLRYCIKPILAKQGIRFENVLFVTDTALDEDSFRAVSFVWSIKCCDLPTVHEARVAQTSSHLIGEETSPEHVFLKVEAFKMDADIAIVSDLDVIVTNPDKLADRLAEFSRRGRHWTKMPPGQVAVLQRAKSQIVMDQPPQQVLPNTGNKTLQQQSRLTPVSYCFALIRTCKKMAARYESKMASESQVASRGVLSDQDLLAEVLANDFLLLNHDLISFPSWWVHADLWKKRSTELKSLINKKIDPQGRFSLEENGKRLTFDFGCVHLSRGFDFVSEAVTVGTKTHFWEKQMNKPNVPGSSVGNCNQPFFEKEDYTRVLAGFWEELRHIHMTQITRLLEDLQNAGGHCTPTMGMSKCSMAMLRELLAMSRNGQITETRVTLKPAKAKGRV